MLMKMNNEWCMLCASICMMKMNNGMESNRSKQMLLSGKSPHSCHLVQLVSFVLYYSLLPRSLVSNYLCLLCMLSCYLLVQHTSLSSPYTLIIIECWSVFEVGQTTAAVVIPVNFDIWLHFIYIISIQLYIHKSISCACNYVYKYTYAFMDKYNNSELMHNDKQMTENTSNCCNMINNSWSCWHTHIYNTTIYNT